MTTRINITVDQSGLLARAANQTRANHEALAIQQKQKKTEEAAVTKITEKRRSLGQDIKTGKPLAIATPAKAGGYGDINGNNRIGQDPAANRRQAGRRELFGFYEVTEGTIAEEDDPLELPPDSSIKFKQLDSLKEVDDTFSVVWVGTRNACFTYSEDSWFGDQLFALAQFARKGGIVAISSEWSAQGCAVGFRELDSSINKAFGTSIQQQDGVKDFFYNDSLPLGASRSVFLALDRSIFMPTEAPISASATFSGGVILYANDSFTTSVYQKVGKGVLLRWGDSNEVGSDPLKKLSVNRRGTLVSMAEGLVRWQQSGAR